MKSLMRHPLARHVWRRFRPQSKGYEVTLRPPVDSSLWQRASAYVDELFPGRQWRDDALGRIIQSTRDQAETTNDPVLWIAALILQTPRAASAQEQMDQHPHGYRNKRARLYELIDFNDTYVSAVLSLPEHELAAFADETKQAMDSFCKRLKTRCLSYEQFEAITHGLSREIAVYRGALKEGYDVRMTSRTEDAFGIDMVITDPTAGHAINVDCKTHSAYYYRLQELMREGRMTTEQAGTAEDKGYCRIVNGDETQRAVIVLWRIDQQTYGPIEHFSFVDSTQLGVKLHEIMHDESLRS